MIFKSLSKIQSDLNHNETTILELVETYLSNINKHETNNAFVEVFAEEAKQRAEHLDGKFKNNPDAMGPLFGAVISIKDNLCYENHQVSAGSKMLANFTSPYSATVVQRLIDADAIIIGRTNCDEFSMGSTSETSFYGPVKNAVNVEHVAGGSSGGAAVSIKLNQCLAAIGSDTGGSIRQPASFNGVLGFKPTYGIVSRWGLIAYGSSLDAIGVLSHDVSTISDIINVISGQDQYDSTMLQEPVPQLKLEQFDLSHFKIATLTELVQHQKLDSSVKNSFDLFIKNEGLNVEEISFPLTEYLVPAYYILCCAEASSNLSRFDGIRYGHKSSEDVENFNQQIKNSRTEGFGLEVKKRIILGNYVLSEGYYDAYFKKAQQVRSLIKTFIDDLFDKYDFIILPTTTSEAWLLGESTKDPIEMYLADMYTVLANLCGIPAINIPLTNKNSILPLGIQILAKSGNDGRILSFVSNLSNASKA
ncbi:MAG: Asp-tRNA(Asn)/Glu-tRNA(Gln) amidotransferase subunit GatA [Saprospiraceae bacterium]|nr:Asp-tRNA(Asn)/Glu-tRNA(Gln) amidotransferase subunit GatA [Saprospiraceae bacterium]